MTVVFAILVVYAFFFVFLAVDDRGADRMRPSAGTDQPIAFPTRDLVGDDDTYEAATHTELAV